MAIKKFGILGGVNIARIVKPVGVRLRCEFLDPKHEPVEFDIAGDLALAIAKEMEHLLPSAAAAPKAVKRRPTAAKPKLRVV